MALTPVNGKSFAWCDTETTGLDPDKHDIIEIAIVRVAPDGTETEFYAKVQMARPENAHPKALAVNGYTAEKWAEARSVEEVFREIHARGLLHDCILAGQNIAFDAGFINATYKRLGIATRVDYHTYDTVTLALAYLRPWLKSVSLTPVCVALGISPEGAHGALADCRMAMAVNKALLEATPEERASWPTVIPARLAAWEAQR